MRTIKFKAKAIRGDRSWTFGDLVHALNDICINPEHGFKRQQRYLTAVDPDTVCQFTGFLDKNGKEIYEGDVLRSDSYPYSFLNDNKRDNYFAVVYYCEEGACFAIVTAKNHELDVRGFLDGTITSVSQQKLRNFEVVGNIHEPEWEQYGEWFQFGSAKY